MRVKYCIQLKAAIKKKKKWGSYDTESNQMLGDSVDIESNEMMNGD